MNILEEANKVVNERQTSYDGPEDNFRRIASLTSGYFREKYGHEIDREDVAAWNILQKMARQMWQHKDDNLIDIAGYAQCWQRIVENDNKDT